MRHHRIGYHLCIAALPILLLGVLLRVELVNLNVLPRAGISQSAYINQNSLLSPTSTLTTKPGGSKFHSSSPGNGSGKSALPVDWSMLIPTLIATFAGALLALLTVIFGQRYSERRTRRKETQAARTHLRELLDLVRRELMSNQREVSAILLDLESNPLTDRTPVFDVWNANGTEILRTNNPAGIRITEAYVLLRRFDRVLSQYQENVSRKGSSLRDARVETLQVLRSLGREAQSALAEALMYVQAETTSLT